MHEEPRYACHFEQCNLKYAHPKQLKLHIKKDHLNEAFHKCNFVGCDFTTNLRINLDVHCGSQHGVQRPNLNCEIRGCSYTTQNPVALHLHKRRMHRLGVKPQFACHFLGCQAHYFTSERLIQHFGAKHRVKMPFSCSYRDCSFNTFARYRLKNHINAKHTREILYECNELRCNYSTNNKYSFSQHQNSVHHYGRRKRTRYACHFMKCVAICQTRVQLLQHFHSQHGVKLPLSL